MEITNMLNGKGAATAEHQLQQHFAPNVQSNGRNSSDTGSETSEHSSKYASQNSLHPMANVPYERRYPSPSQMSQTIPILPAGYMARPFGFENGYTQAMQQIPSSTESQRGVARTSGGEAMKAFACTNCGKGFARRSDLARHERIHSGVRPHVCDYPGCNKQFIQRSALTVHARVHTGEKPHMCERCGKPFSDSSSLARHRRIHSGKRPYKCPFADCQKTFTRRTTLTRHQNHHTGTVEEAAAATAAALASHPSGRPQTVPPDGGLYSDGESANSSPSPKDDRASLSPPTDTPRIPAMHRQHSDFSYMSPGSLPSHMRGDIHQQQQQQQQNSRLSPANNSPPLSSYGGNQHRPEITSHPTAAIYGPPPTLEPPTQHEHRQSGNVNGNAHLGTVGWQSPQSGMVSPSHGEMYMYPEPPFGAAVPNLYYQNSNTRRPQSTEPYDTKPRLIGGEVWGGPV